LNIHKFFPYTPTTDQSHAIIELEAFLKSDSQSRIFLLKGYAGTGKTTILGSLAQALKESERSFALLAPTGRAAKVISKHSAIPANTIHSFLYQSDQTDDGRVVFTLRNIDLWPNTVLIIDEASMVSNKPSGKEEDFLTPNGIIDDIFTILSKQATAKIIFIGDLAQLPPVKEHYSLALDGPALEERYDLASVESELHQVTRQASNSGPLVTATYMRQMIVSSQYKTKKVADLQNGDIQFISSNHLVEKIKTAYNRFGQDNSAVVCHSNKRAVKYNLQIRKMILGYFERLAVGERVMVVKNYRDQQLDEFGIPFIANGEIVKVISIGSEEKQDEFNFQQLVIQIEKLDGAMVEISILANLATLTSHTPRFSPEDYKKLRSYRRKEYGHLPPGEIGEALKQDPYLNALQIKYGYAFTCHKSQGGQWDHVFVDHENIFRFPNKEENHRWFYTAITRTAHSLSLINFPQSWIYVGLPSEVKALIQLHTPTIQDNKDLSLRKPDRADHFPIPEVEINQLAPKNIAPESSKSSPNFIRKTDSPIPSGKRRGWTKISPSLIFSIVVLLMIMTVFLFNRQPPRSSENLVQMPSIPAVISPTGIPRTSTPLPTHTPIPTLQSIVSGCVTVNQLRVRSAPSLSSNLLGGLTFGTCQNFDAISEDGEWLRIQMMPGETQEKWVFLAYIELDDDIHNLPTSLP
jgi:exodeoxyribonuclease V